MYGVASSARNCARWDDARGTRQPLNEGGRRLKSAYRLSRMRISALRRSRTELERHPQDRSRRQRAERPDDVARHVRVGGRSGPLLRIDDADVVVAKCLAYALSLGAGFPGAARLPGARSRPSAVTAADILPGLETTPAVAAGIVAATYAVPRVPFMAVLLATLLVGSSAFDTAPISVLAAVVGWIVAIALPNPEDRREPQGGGHARQRVMISQRIVNPAAANLG